MFTEPKRWSPTKYSKNEGMYCFAVHMVEEGIINAYEDVSYEDVSLNNKTYTPRVLFA